MSSENVTIHFCSRSQGPLNSRSFRTRDFVGSRSQASYLSCDRSRASTREIVSRKRNCSHLFQHFIWKFPTGWLWFQSSSVQFRYQLANSFGSHLATGPGLVNNGKKAKRQELNERCFNCISVSQHHHLFTCFVFPVVMFCFRCVFIN